MAISWQALGDGWVKLNTDGSSLRNPKIVSAGGLIRDHNGTLSRRFASNVGHACRVLAGLWALKDGLSLALSLGFPYVKLDALVVIFYCVNGSGVFPRLMNLVDDCSSLLLQIPNYLMSHIFKDGSKCYDALARIMRGSSPSDFVIFTFSKKKKDFVIFIALLQRLTSSDRSLEVLSSFGKCLCLVASILCLSIK